LTIAVLALVWIGYIAWPIYDLLVLIRAVETRDIRTVTRHVYFDQVRVSLTNQIIDAYTRRTGVQISPFARTFASAGLAVADPVIQKLISPEALSQFLTVGWPVTAVPDAPPPAKYAGNNNEHDRDLLADFRECSVWLWPVRSGRARCLTGAPTFPS
jgi:Protein of unknown function (DUF2939)